MYVCETHTRARSHVHSCAPDTCWVDGAALSEAKPHEAVQQLVETLAQAIANAPSVLIIDDVDLLCPESATDALPSVVHAVSDVVAACAGTHVRVLCAVSTSDVQAVHKVRVVMRVRARR